MAGTSALRTTTLLAGMAALLAVGQVAWAATYYCSDFGQQFPQTCTGDGSCEGYEKSGGCEDPECRTIIGYTEEGVPIVLVDPGDLNCHEIT